MEDKPNKKKRFWKLKREKYSFVEKQETVNNLRSIFLDDTSMKRPVETHSDVSVLGDNVTRRGVRPLRECQSLCIATPDEKSFFAQIQAAATTTKPSMAQVHDIHVWYKNVLYQVNRVITEGHSSETEFLKKVFSLLLPEEELPEDITSAFRVLVEGSEFRRVRSADVFANGSLLKLTTDPKLVNSPHAGSSSSDSSSNHPHSPPPSAAPQQRPGILPAPLLRRRAITSATGKAIPDRDTDSPSTPDSIQMHSHKYSGGPPAGLPPNSTLVPATMQVGKNGERHLILHYPDGHSLAATTTVIPNQARQFHLVPLVQPQQQPSPRLVTTQADTFQISSGRRHQHQQQLQQNQPASCVEAHTHVVRNKAGQNVELMCTCPPELHQAIRHSHGENATLTRPASDEELIRRLKLGHTSRSTPPPVVGWTAPQPSDRHSNSPSGESTETFQESDSSGGSGQLTFFPSIRKGIAPPDVLLASVLNEQMKKPTKPPQTLEEAQYRIAHMEAQLAQLTAWVQGGLASASKETKPLPSHPSFESFSSVKTCSSTDSDSPVLQFEATKCLNTSPGGKQHRLREAFEGLGDLRCGLQVLRCTAASNARQMKAIANGITEDITTLLKTSNLGGSTPVRQVQLALDGQITEYKTGLQEVDRWLTDLEACIEELRVDALNRRCRVSVSEVETYALHLSRLSRRLASYKGHIPELRNASSILTLAHEAEIKQLDEFLCTEPTRLDAALSACKHLTCTLFTLKRLGSVQENGISVHIPLLRTIRDPQKEDKQLYLQQIRQIIPNHDARMSTLACNEKTRERRKRMLSLRESSFFEGCVDQTDSNLRRILERLNELRRKYLSAEQNEQNEKLETEKLPADMSQPALIKSDTWVCPIHQESSKLDGEGCDFYDAKVPPKTLRGSADGESSATSSSNEMNTTQPLPVASRGSRRARVVFSRTVLVDAGRETTRLNCPSDLDDTGDTGSEADDYQPWRREQLHKGNRVVDIHPGLPRNQYIICDGRCGAPACAEGSCLARQKGSTGSVLKTTTAYGPGAVGRMALSTMTAPRVNMNDLDASSVDSEGSEKQLIDPTSVYEMRTHHQCCRLNNNSNNNPSNCQ